MPTPLANAIDDALRASGVDLATVGRAWARATPLVVIVPAFGLRVLPAATRIGLALAFAATIFPAVALASPTGPVGPAGMVLVLELLRGLPVAIATAVPLWAASMAGGLADNLRGAQEGAPFALVEGRPTPLAVLFGLAAAAVFLSTGGPARAVVALLAAPESTPWLRIASSLSHGIGLAVAIAAPILAVSVVLEIAGALVARASSPTHVDAILQPMKAIALLVFVALALERMIALAR